MQSVEVTIALQQTGIVEDIQFIVGPSGDSEGLLFSEDVRLGWKDGECIQSLSCTLRQPLIGDGDDRLERELCVIWQVRMAFDRGVRTCQMTHSSRSSLS